MTSPATLNPAPLRQGDSPRQVAAAPSAWRVVGRVATTIWSNRKARIGVVILGVFLLTAIFAPLLAPYDGSANGFARSANTQVPTGSAPPPRARMS